MNKYDLHGYDTRKQMFDCLSYLRDTETEAIAICRKLHPNFDIDHVEIDENWPATI